MWIQAPYGVYYSAILRERSHLNVKSSYTCLNFSRKVQIKSQEFYLLG